jgi:hypothetical protein
LVSISDWDRNREDSVTMLQLRDAMRDRMWMVELSVPDLFSTNKRKVGELLLDATIDFSLEGDFTTFVVARLPGTYIFFGGMGANGEPEFVTVKSLLASHTPLYRTVDWPLAT